MADNGLSPQLKTIDKMKASHRQKPAKANNTSGFKGVFKSKSNKWEAKIFVFGKQRYLGSFERIEEAAKAYDAHALHFFGPSAYLNFPDQSKKA